MTLFFYVDCIIRVNLCYSISNHTNRANTMKFDVFLSHNSEDKPAVEVIGLLLQEAYNLKCWLDKWYLVPGEPWQEALEKALDDSQAVAVFIGPNTISLWENEEMRNALEERVQNKSRRVIPVLLPGAPDKESLKLPRFLRRLTWVDFRTGGLHDISALHRLYCGISGKIPGSPVELAAKFDASAIDLQLVFSAGFYEDELATQPATSAVYSRETYHVKLDWRFEGKLAAHFCGVWQVKIGLDAIGKADEYTSELYTIDMDPCQKDGYSHTFIITPDTVHPAEHGTVYVISATLSTLDPCGRPGQIWAYGMGTKVIFVPGTAT
jgi:hypothetical protein